MSEGMIIRRGGVGSSITPYIVTVTCDSAFAGQTISMSQTGQQTVSATCPSSSPYTVELHPMYSGTWTISGTISGSTITKNITLSSWGNYTETLSSFNAYIRVLTKTNGAVVTATYGSTSISETATTPWLYDDYYYVDIYVPTTGSWYISDNQPYNFDNPTINVTESTGYTTKLYHGLYLYNLGDECTSVTGGWTNVSANVSGYNAVTPYLQKQDTYLNCVITSEGNYGIGRVKTVNAINLTPFNKLCIYSPRGRVNYKGKSYFGADEVATDIGYTYNASLITPPSSGYTNLTKKIDISSVTGTYNVGIILARLGDSSNNAQIIIEIEKFWLEID